MNIFFLFINNNGIHETNKGLICPRKFSGEVNNIFKELKYDHGISFSVNKLGSNESSEWDNIPFIGPSKIEGKKGKNGLPVMIYDFKYHTPTTIIETNEKMIL